MPSLQITSDRAVSLLLFALQHPYDKEIHGVAARCVCNVPGDFVETLGVGLSRLGQVDNTVLVELFTLIGRYERLDIVVEMTGHETAAVRGAAIKVVGDLGTSQHIALLEKLCSDDVRSVQESAECSIQRLQNIGWMKTRTFDNALHQDDELIAALALGEPYEEHDIARLAQLAEPQTGFGESVVAALARDRLISIGPSITDAVFRAISTANKNDFLLRFLCLMRDQRAMEISAKILDRGAWIPEEATRFLAEVATETFISRLLGMLGRASGSAKHEVRSFLTSLGQRAASQLLVAFSVDRPFRMREGQLLAKTAGTRALPLLLEALQDRLRSIRLSAEDGLSVLGSASADAVVSLLSHRDKPVRLGALRILGSIGEPRTSSAVADLARSGDPEERWEAVRALGAFDDARSIALVTKSATSKDWRMRLSAAVALRKRTASTDVALLIPLARDGNENVRIGAMDSLRVIARRSSTEQHVVGLMLLDLLDSESTVVSKSAEQCLVYLNDSSLVREAMLSASGSLLEKLDRIHMSFNMDRMAHSVAYSAHHPDERPPTRVAYPLTDAVRMSVTAPAIVVQGRSFLLDVWLHRDHLLDEVLERARGMEYRKKIRLRSGGPIMIERGSAIGVQVDIPELGFRETDSIYWSENIGNTNFAIAVPSTVPIGACSGAVRFCLDGLPIGRLYFDLEVGGHQGEVEDRTTHESRISSAFASYASEDRAEVVGRIQGMQKLLPSLDVFLDVASLRSGEKWKARLQEEIAIRDVFYLFWSRAASRSQWVDFEWRTALATKGIDAIDPVPLEPVTVAPPPDELASLHFNEWLLAFT